MITTIVVFLILAAYCFDLLVSQLKNGFFYGLMGCIAIIGVLGFKNNKGIGDVDLGAYDAMQVQEYVVKYCEAHNFYEKRISAHSPLQREHLTLPNTGFLSTGRIFNSVKASVEPQTEVIIIDNIETDSSFVKEHYGNFQQVYRIEKGSAWGEIYQLKSPK